MLFNLLTSLIENYSFLNVFKYLTFRTGLSLITSLTVVFLIGGPLIKIFSKNQIAGPIRQDGPIDHIIKKSGTPTMGGLIIIIGMISGTLLWADLNNIFIWILIFVSLGLGILGFIDDLLKIKFENSRGLNLKLKFLGQLIISLIALYMLIEHSDHEYLYNLYFPFFKNLILHLGLFFIPFALFVIIGASNAVNLTDGLDGLAAGLLAISVSVFGVIAYISGRVDFTDYLYIAYLPLASELTIFATAFFGGCLGFLWFNAKPAEIFMGDVGSLSTGAALGTLAILLKKEVLLLIVGGVFVIETLSVIIQVLYFRYTKNKYGEGKKFFLMAPIHHHFELKGWPESRVVTRFWIIGILFALMSLTTFKVR